MNSKGSNKLYRNFGKFFLVSYLVYALTNIFVIPQYTPVSYKHPKTQIKNHKLNANYNNINFIRLIERSILNEDQTNPIKFLPVIILIVFGGFVLLKTNFKLIAPQTYRYHNSRHSYLNFLTIRI